jgi:hypothetical protein
MPAKFPLALAMMVCLLLCATVSQLWAALSWGHDSFQMTEWLINYSGGFVRRGLSGTILQEFSQITGIQANHLAIAVSLVSYLGLAYWLIRRASPTIPAIFILSCVAIGFPAYQDGIVRKDCFGLLVLIFCSSMAAGRRAPWVRVLGINAAACVALLIHETWAFYSIPALILLTRPSDEPVTAGNALARAMSLIPAMACLGFTVVYHGTPDVAKAIHQSWMPLWRSIGSTAHIPDTPCAAIDGIGWTSQQGMHLSLHLFQTGWYQPVAWLIVILISFFLCVWFSGRDCNRDDDRTGGKAGMAALLVFQFASISPLFILGVDWGRWLFFWLVSSIILRTLGYRSPRWLEKCVGRIMVAMKAEVFFSRFRAPDWILLLFGFPVCWSLFNFITASPLIRHLYLLGSYFR